ncbi:tagatose-6-phosphate ketose isomerase [Bacillus manliponensis]|uniref:Tagatose-6-phosphate ketose isomerase n=1 Tax=Bacillus manliponensis TaxID=574376 RepID=A0A073K916_9BACI|nr:SIS domain-containing protein [Bacillus manliponensis]KEK18778.1 tagatose-6-phosphate ketose isomerase [Bacillus manliponensis]
MLLHANEQMRDTYGANFTAKEIAQQPELWRNVYEIIEHHYNEIDQFFTNIFRKHEQVRVIFTGAGTSAFVGDTIAPYIKKMTGGKKLHIESVPTTNIVSNPYYYLQKDVPTIMVSFARSGNSPESTAATALGEQIVTDIYHMILTCNKEGELAKKFQQKNNALLLYMPPEANDQGFAMTGSFTSMMLTALLLCTYKDVHGLKTTIMNMVRTGKEIIEKQESAIQKIAEKHFHKIVFLGSGVFEGLARESALKFLELTAGQIPVMFDTPLGFRHGPKSILKKGTVVVLFLSTNAYTRKYDIDLLKEVFAEKERNDIIVVAHQENEDARKYCDTFLCHDGEDVTDDVYVTFFYILYGQILALHKSITLGITPDNPCPSGSVNRVVQGVTIHSYVEGE